MKKLLSAVLLLTAAALPLAAQTFGELFPATNTRYRTAFGTPHLTTNGKDFYLFWGSEQKVRATRLIDGEARAGHLVFEVGGGFDVAWTGDRFLAVTTQARLPYSSDNDIIARVLDSEARPLGPVQTIVRHGRLPEIAAGPEHALVVYRQNSTNEIRALALEADGTSTGAQSQSLAADGTDYDVAGNGNGFVAAISEMEAIHAVAFDRNGQIIGDRTLPLGERFNREISVATDGTRYVAVWSEIQGVMAATIDANGTFGPSLLIDSTVRFPRAPGVIWNGGGWTVTYGGPGSTESRARVAQLDYTAQRIVASEVSPEGVGYPSVAALDGRIVAAWAPANYKPGGVSVSDLPLATNQPRLASFSATQQTLMATATSDAGTLVIWREGSDGSTSLRAGLRTYDGRWSERELAANLDYVGRVIADSDGRNFMLVYIVQGRARMIRLDENGQPVAPQVTLPNVPEAMAWNGTHYGLVDPSGSGLLITASGQISAPIALPPLTFSAEAMASNGDGFLVAGELQECPFILCYSAGIQALRLGADLQPTDPSEISFAYGNTEITGAVWNGSEYVVVWSEHGTNRLAEVPSNRNEAIRIRTMEADLYPDAITAMSDGSLAIVGRVTATVDTAEITTERVAIVAKNSDVAKLYDVESNVDRFVPTRLAPLPNNGLVYVSSTMQNAAPHHGTTHVMMAVASTILPPRPAAPYVTARIEGGHIDVDWTAPAGTLNGYRLEYRVDDGSWNELDQWFSASAHHTTITRPAFGTRFMIRMRAFSDGGASEYSTTAVANPTRRRAAR